MQPQQKAKVKCPKCNWITTTKSARKYISCTSCRKTLQNPLYREAKYFEIWYSDGNDRTQLARVKAFDIVDIDDLVKTEFLTKEAYESAQVEYNEFDTVYMLDVCSECEANNLSEEQKEQECEFCELSEYITVELDEYDKTEDFKTIYGTNDFYDLTKEKPQKKPNWNNDINKAWLQNPQKGIAALIMHDVETKKPYAKAFSKELIEKCKKDVEE